MRVRPRVADVYGTSYPRLVVQMLAICGNQADAEDAVQEAFVRAMLSRSFGRSDNPEAWLRSVALDHQRNGWWHLAAVRRYRGRAPGPQLPLELGPDHVAILEALAQVEPPLREVAVLHHLADESIPDIAAELSLPVGTVRSRLSRCRSSLAPLLEDEREDA